VTGHWLICPLRFIDSYLAERGLAPRGPFTRPSRSVYSPLAVRLLAPRCPLTCPSQSVDLPLAVRWLAPRGSLTRPFAVRWLAPRCLLTALLVCPSQSVDSPLAVFWLAPRCLLTRPSLSVDKSGSRNTPLCSLADYTTYCVSPKINIGPQTGWRLRLCQLRTEYCK
jgi:hypothetical protein